MDPITRAYEAQVDDVSASQRTVTAVINTAAVDRYRTVIDPAGIDLGEYQANPVVLWEHGKDPTRGRLPIGRNQWLNRRTGKLIAKTEFGRDDYSQNLFEMYRDGTLRGWSIFALPDMNRTSPPTREEIRSRPELAECELMYRACKLAEYSGVAVPGNHETLTILAERGIWCPPERSTATTPPPQARADEDAPATEAGHDEPDADADDEPQSRYIKKVGGKWGVYSEAGKLLGEHDSEAGAKEQLAAVEAHKRDAGRSLPPLEGTTFRAIHAAMAGEVERYYRDRIDLVAATLDLIRGRV